MKHKILMRGLPYHSRVGDIYRPSSIHILDSVEAKELCDAELADSLGEVQEGAHMDADGQPIPVGLVPVVVDEEEEADPVVSDEIEEESDEDEEDSQSK